MNYKQALEYLDSFIDYEKIIDYPYNASLNLRRMERLCEFFDNPQETFKSIHIAGTKGKGSVAAAISSILKENGLKVGLYTSPHLISPRERIRVMSKSLQPIAHNSQPDLLGLEGMISEEEAASFIEKVKPAVEEIRQNKDLGEISFFEIYTILSFLYFARKNVDIAVLETGMGGRLDATNVVRPLVAVFTPISLDHTDKLGPHLTDIAREKAGIIKQGCSVVSLTQPEGVTEIIKHACSQKRAPFHQVNGQTYDEYAGLFSLSGRYQRQNLVLALEVIKRLERYNIKVSSDSIKRGLKKVVWPGRMQVIEKSPLLILDGAQNRASAGALRESLKDFSFDNLILLLGVSANKNIEGIAGELCPQARQVVLTKADNPRATEPEVLELEVKKYCQNTVLTRSIKEALAEVRQVASKDDLILVTGSLYLIGEVLKLDSK
ncbi:MAG: folylpolyglutamate synthase/dihydrofolate synthase family protein [Candidatus Omnitrophota bacterium]|nr:folylpolyglutamate synthase/dihydrofolate synthase family protein [Candidatus Omnitrophota bacterium]